ncbi:MAG: DUF4336 domain-containing protein [Bauldia litoralis]
MTVAETPLAPFGPDIWVKRVPLRFFTFPMGARMTVIRLPGDALFVHSPVKLTPETRKAVDSLGLVRFLVAPNRLHHLFIGDWAAAFPEAELWGVRDLMRKRADLRWTGVLRDAPEPGWAGAIDQAILSSWFQDEAVFCHHASKTLIVVDFLESVWPEDSWHYRLFARAAGTWKRATTTYDQRPTFRNRAKLRGTVRRILGWDFERIVLAHGRLIEADGKAEFRKGVAWLRP